MQAKKSWRTDVEVKWLAQGPTWKVKERLGKIKEEDAERKEAVRLYQEIITLTRWKWSIDGLVIRVRHVLHRIKKNNIFNQIYDKLNSEEKAPEKVAGKKEEKKEAVAEDVLLDVCRSLFKGTMRSRTR